MYATEKMKEELKRKVEEGLGIQAEYIVKSMNNGESALQLSLQRQGDSVGIALYVDSIIEDLKNGIVTMDMVLEYINHCLEQNLPKEELKEYIKKEKILKYVQYAVVNLEKNKEMLKDIPHKEWLDLAVIYNVCVSLEERKGRMLINNLILESSGISLEELDAAARVNTQNSGFEIFPMSEVMKSIGFFTKEEITTSELVGPLFIGSNQDRYKGACILLYPELIHPLAERNGCDLLIAPSSIHEVVFYTKAANLSVEEIKETVIEVNKELVDLPDILGDSVYRYSRETRQITKVA